jgi:hypothetical protein
MLWPMIPPVTQIKNAHGAIQLLLLQLAILSKMLRDYLLPFSNAAILMLRVKRMKLSQSSLIIFSNKFPEFHKFS